MTLEPHARLNLEDRMCWYHMHAVLCRSALSI